MNLRTRFIATGSLAAAAMFSLTLSGIGRGQQPGDPKVNEIKKLQFIGADTCRRCHRAPQPEDEKQKVTEFLRLDEFAIWQDNDLHAKAFQVLTGPLGKQMGAILGWGDVSKRVECLACHAINLSQEMTPGVPQIATTPEVFHTLDGVGCEACHGVADKWFRPHFDKSWRSETPDKKLAAGERDMRDPVARAERCSACHVANSAEGKFVTHAMYAAGHPPLPPLEVMTFSRDQQMHYSFARDLPYFESLDAEAAWKLFHYRKGESQAARQVAVGAVVVFREAMKTLGHSASQGAGMLDFALFNCSACHHELESPSWRQARGYSTAPGRPLPFTGPTALLRSVVRHAADSDASLQRLAAEFDAKQAALMKAFGERPFGDPAAAATAARDAVVWCDAVLKALESKRYDEKETLRLMRAMADAAQRAPLAYDDAQQLVWALGVLAGDKQSAKPDIFAELEKIGGTDKPLSLRLKQINQPRPLIANDLPARLRFIAAYRPEPFQQALGRIAGLLPNP